MSDQEKRPGGSPPGQGAWLQNRTERRFNSLKRAGWVILMIYFGIAAYHNTRTEVRQWLGYKEDLQCQLSTPSK